MTLLVAELAAVEGAVAIVEANLVGLLARASRDRSREHDERTNGRRRMVMAHRHDRIAGGEFIVEEASKGRRQGGDVGSILRGDVGERLVVHV